MSVLEDKVREKALAYVQEAVMPSATSFPTSIIDFVIEYSKNSCNFPKSFSDEKIEDVLIKHTSTIAMACVEVYSRVGTEGQSSHNEPGVSRSYNSAWISPILTNVLPNYVSVF